MRRLQHRRYRRIFPREPGRGAPGARAATTVVPADTAELLRPAERAAARGADIALRCRGGRGCLRRRGGLICRRGRYRGSRGHGRALRDFHQAFAAELIARVDRVAACPADGTGNRGCCGYRCRRCLSRGGMGCRREGYRGSRGHGRALRDFHQAFAAEFIARVDRVTACTADSTGHRGCCGCRGYLSRGGADTPAGEIPGQPRSRPNSPELSPGICCRIYRPGGSGCRMHGRR